MIKRLCNLFDEFTFVIRTDSHYQRYVLDCLLTVHWGLTLGLPNTGYPWFRVRPESTTATASEAHDSATPARRDADTKSVALLRRRRALHVGSHLEDSSSTTAQPSHVSIYPISSAFQ